MQPSETETGQPDQANPSSPSTQIADNGPLEPGPRNSAAAAEVNFEDADLAPHQRQDAWQQPTRTQLPDRAQPQPVDFDSTPITDHPIAVGSGSRESSANSSLDLEQYHLPDGLPAQNDSTSTDPIENSGSQTLGHEIEEAGGPRQVPIQAAVDDGPPDTYSELSPDGRPQSSSDPSVESDREQSTAATSATFETPATNATNATSRSDADTNDETSPADTGISIGKAHPSRRSQLATAVGPMTEPSRARSRKTEAAYAARVQHLYRRSLAKRTTDPQMPANVTPLEVVQDFMLAAV